jgi:hypothetical protein
MAAKAEAGENWPWTQPDALEELPLPVAPLDPLLPVAPPVLELAMLPPPPPPPHAPSSATAGINVTANTDLRKAIIVDILSKRVGSQMLHGVAKVRNRFPVGESLHNTQIICATVKFRVYIRPW